MKKNYLDKSSEEKKKARWDELSLKKLAIIKNKGNYIACYFKIASLLFWSFQKKKIVTLIIKIIAQFGHYR